MSGHHRTGIKEGTRVVSKHPKSAPPTPDDLPLEPMSPALPQHPDHAMYKQIRQHVTKLDKDHGRTFDDVSERLISSLLALAKANRLTRVDHVVLSNPTDEYPTAHNVFVVEGDLDNPGHRRASMETVVAVTPPAEDDEPR